MEELMMPLRSVLLLALVGGSLVTQTMPSYGSRYRYDRPITLSGKIVSVFGDDDVILEVNNQRFNLYKLDFPRFCKPALRYGTLRVGNTITVSGWLEHEEYEREVKVRTVRLGNRQICP